MNLEERFSDGEAITLERFKSYLEDKIKEKGPDWLIDVSWSFPQEILRYTLENHE